MPHTDKSISEFIAMKNIVNSWLNSYIMTEFINLILILIQLYICFSEGNVFTHPKEAWPLFCSQLTTSPRLLCCCCWVATKALLRQQTSGAAVHSSTERTWRAFKHINRHHWHWDLPDLLVSNGRIFRDLQYITNVTQIIMWEFTGQK